MSESRVPRRVAVALDRLITSFAVQELAGLRRAPKLVRRPRFAAFAARLLAAAERWGLRDPALTPARAPWLYAILTIALRAGAGTFWRQGAGAVVPHVRARVAEHAGRIRAVASYAASSADESQALRISLLLRAMGRRAASARVLIERVRSGLPSPRVSRLLAAWLTEVGEAKAAALLPSVPPAARPERLPHTPRRLRFGVVVMTMFDTPVFRASVRSLLDSDFQGQIVVVEDGNEERPQCREFCASVGVTYVKSPEWDGCAAALNLGIGQLQTNTDVVLSSHSDVLWPPVWFADLDRTWDAVWDGGKVGLLNLSYLQINSRVDPALTELFLEGEYDDLVWVLRAMRDVPSICDQVQDIQLKPGEAPFGLGRDPWIDWIAELRQQTGRYSVGASFPMAIWRELGGFDPDLVYAFDLQLLEHNVKHRRWALFVNTPPVIHLKSSDTEHIAPDKMAQIGTRFLTSTYDGFQQKFGWHIEHYLNLYFSESTVVHRDAILRAANEGRLDDADFVFDDFSERLATRRLDNCELTWCRTRASCPYV